MCTKSLYSLLIYLTTDQKFHVKLFNIFYSIVPSPEVTVTQSMEGSYLGQVHTLDCTVTVANGVSSSLVSVTWMADSSPEHYNVSGQTNVGLVYSRTVTFSPLRYGDMGQYNCFIAVNGFEEARNSGSIMVVVNGV